MIGRVVVGGLALALLLLAGGPARGFTRSAISGGTAVYWTGSCIYIQPDSAGTPDLPFPTVLDAIGRSIGNWQDATATCAYLRLIQDAPAPLEAKNDGRNTVKFRMDRWCRPADGSSPEICYSATATAITSILYRPSGKETGRIIDADIELNGINFTFGVVDALPRPTARDGTTLADLENTLTHEFGHVQGLDHTCWDHVQATNPLDENGDPIPECGDVWPRCAIDAATCQEITQATMFNFANPGETRKRDVTADDIAGICAIYPVAKDPHSCRSPGADSGGCAVHPGSPLAPSLLVLLGTFALLALALRRRGG